MVWFGGAVGEPLRLIKKTFEERGIFVRNPDLSLTNLLEYLFMFKTNKRIE